MGDEPRSEHRHVELLDASKLLGICLAHERRSGVIKQNDGLGIKRLKRLAEQSRGQRPPRSHLRCSTFPFRSFRQRAELLRSVSKALERSRQRRAIGAGKQLPARKLVSIELALHQDYGRERVPPHANTARGKRIELLLRRRKQRVPSIGIRDSHGSPSLDGRYLKTRETTAHRCCAGLQAHEPVSTRAPTSSRAREHACHEPHRTRARGTWGKRSASRILIVAVTAST